MNIKTSLKYCSGLNQIHIIPLIDIVFLLISFIILLSPLVSQPSINIKVPKAITSDAIQEDNIVITITGENILYVNDQIITLRKLRDSLQKNHKKQQAILLKADRRCSLSQVFSIWDLCRELGIENINIATNQEQ